MATNPSRAEGSSWQHVIASDRAQIHAGHSYGDVHNTVSNHNYTFVLNQERPLALGSSERIGMTACISGLKALTSDLQARLSGSKASQIPIVSDLLAALQRSSSLLGGFENYFRPGVAMPPERASLVPVDQLVACFASAVLLFNNLQQEIRSIKVSKEYVDDGQEHESSLKVIVERLNNQCQIWQTLSLLLQCATEDEAHRASFTWEIQTHTLLAEHADLRYRLDSMGEQIEELSQRVNVKQYVRDGIQTLNKQRQFSVRAWEFEEVLQRSWVYRRNERREETMSFRSSVARDHAWSEISKLTLANVSTISVIALPIKLSELEDSRWYQMCDPYLVRSSIIMTVATPMSLGKPSLDQSSAVQARDIEIARELKIEKDGQPTWLEDQAKTVSSLRLELTRRPSKTATSNYSKKARVWASRIPAAELEIKTVLQSAKPQHDISLTEPTLDYEYLDNNDYDTLNVADRGLYMMHYHDLESIRYTTQILVTTSDNIQRLLIGLKTLSHLKNLSLPSTGLKVFPGAILSLPMLASLDISNNFITEIPQSLARMPRLKELTTNGNPLDGFPIEVFQMRSLQRLSVNRSIWYNESFMHFQDIRWEVVESHRYPVDSFGGWVELSRRK